VKLDLGEHRENSPEYNEYSLQYLLDNNLLGGLQCAMDRDLMLSLNTHLEYDVGESLLSLRTGLADSLEERR